jgi:hypothetical protein
VLSLAYVPTPVHPDPLDADVEPFMSAEDCYLTPWTEAQWDALIEAAPPAPEPDAPGEPRLPMADWIEVQASLIRLNGSDLADWLADQIDLLARECRGLRATTPAEFDDRATILAGLLTAHEAMEGGYHGTL